MFFLGATVYVLRHHILLSNWLCSLFGIALLIAAFHTHVFFVVYLCTIAYILSYAAYIPSRGIRNYNRLGDYSYGCYIYAFPVQQTIAALVPGVSILQMMAVSFVVTAFCAVVSWHFLEQRALSLKDRFACRTEKLVMPYSSDPETTDCRGRQHWSPV